MHYAKPRPEFVAEVLAHLAALPEDSLFVGNDPQEDIAPARKLGTASFRAVPGGRSGDGAESGVGTFRTLIDALDVDGGDGPAFPPAPASPCALPARLAGALAALLTMFAESGWAACPAEEGWGPVEIACHLRDVECEIMQARLRLVLTEENPYLAPIELDRWAEERNYRGQDGPAALGEFTRLRKQTIARLKDLGEADWKRPARHALFGPTTLEEQIRFIARHDLLHVEQLQASRYACRE